MTVVSELMNDVDKPGTEVETGIRLTEQQLRARRARSIAIALALGAFVILIFVVTLVRLSSNVLTRPM
jgi:t-SNARE complex subunit (syntaxin)